jgi:hypothetical protein
MTIDQESGSITRHGTFLDVAASLDEFKSAGARALYVVGALERDNGWGDGDGALEANDAQTHLLEQGIISAINSDEDSDAERCGDFFESA